MIDTDKYEGHTPAPWLWYEEDEGLDLVVADDQCRTVIEEVKALNTKADEQLIADAPLLLEEVKRLRESDGQWETHWLFVRNWLEEQMSVDNTVSTKHTIPIYTTVWRVMEALRPRGEEE